MLETEQVTIIFADAWVLHADALEELERGKLRNAAEKAWGATKRATDALVLARTGSEPRSSGQTIRGIRRLGAQNIALKQLELLCTNRSQVLHGMCFYDGNVRTGGASDQGHPGDGRLHPRRGGTGPGGS